MKFKTYKIKDLINEISMGPFGSNIKVECFVDSGIPVLNGSNLTGFALNDNSFRYVTPEKADSLGKANAYRGDIVITHRGTLGQIVFIPKNSKHSRYVISQSQFRVKCNEKILPEYLVYYFHTNAGQHKLLSNASQVGVPALARASTTFQTLEIDIPDVTEQRKIVDLLETIREKIELNNAINNNLEQQADALYQTFFSPKSGTQGKIVTLDEYCSIFTGKKNANASVNGGKYKFFTCAPEALQIDSYIFDGNAIIVSGNGAYTGRTRFYSGKFDLYQRTYACTLLDNVNPDFIFPLYWFVKLELSKKIMGGTRGSAIPYIVMNDLTKFEFIYNEEMFANYTPLFKSLTEAIQANEFESENLAQIRDSLLPKLMSGELDVSDTKL
jgi:restriction endonuclease S subunit